MGFPIGRGISRLGVRNGPAWVFAIETTAVVWSKDLKRRPVTRILLSDVREIHLIRNFDGPDDVAIVDKEGEVRVVESTGRLTAAQAVDVLRQYCPEAILCQTGCG